MISAVFCFIYNTMNKQQIKQFNELLTETLPLMLSDETFNFLQSLPEKQRLCFILRYAYDYSGKQIAENLNISVSAVTSNLNEVKKKSDNLTK